MKLDSNRGIPTQKHFRFPVVCSQIFYFWNFCESSTVIIFYCTRACQRRGDHANPWKSFKLTWMLVCSQTFYFSNDSRAREQKSKLPREINDRDSRPRSADLRRKSKTSASGQTTRMQARTFCKTLSSNYTVTREDDHPLLTVNTVLRFDTSVCVATDIL